MKVIADVGNNVEKFLYDMTENVNKSLLSDKIVEWTNTPNEDGEFTDEEILCILSDPDSFPITKLCCAPHSPISKWNISISAF